MKRYLVFWFDKRDSCIKFDQFDTQTQATMFLAARNFPSAYIVGIEGDYDLTDRT